MSSIIIKGKDTTLVFEDNRYFGGDYIYIESNRVQNYQEMSIKLDSNDLHKLYNAIGKSLGYPEVKQEKQSNV